MRIGDRISGVSALLFSLFVMKESYGLDLGTLYAPDSGFLPFVSALTLGVLALFLLLSSFLRPIQAGAKQGDISFNRPRLIKTSYVIISLFVFAIFLNTIGFLICTMIFLAFLLKAVEPHKWSVVLTLAISVSLISFVIFDVFLKTQLPRGLLAF